MKLLALLTILAIAILALGSGIGILTSTTTTITHAQPIRSSSSPATPYPLPDWELKRRAKWQPVHNGRPCPSEDGCPFAALPEYVRNKFTKRAIPTSSSSISSAATTSAATTPHQHQHHISTTRAKSQARFISPINPPSGRPSRSVLLLAPPSPLSQCSSRFRSRKLVVPLKPLRRPLRAS